jgi:hypothetical protein
MARIEAEASCAVTEAATPSDESIPATRPLPLRRRPWLAIAAAVQTIAIGVLLGGLWWQAQEVQELRNAPRFITRTDQPAAMPQGPVLRVVFANDVSVGEMNQLLREIGAQVISGPSEDAGVYTLALREQGRQPDPVAALETLRADAHVIFAERAIAQAEGR